MRAETDPIPLLDIHIIRTMRAKGSTAASIATALKCDSFDVLKAERQAENAEFLEVYFAKLNRGHHGR